MDIENEKKILSLLDDRKTILHFKKVLEKVSQNIIDEELRKSLADALSDVLVHIEDFDMQLIKVLCEEENRIIAELKVL